MFNNPSDPNSIDELDKWFLDTLEKALGKTGKTLNDVEFTDGIIKELEEKLNLSFSKTSTELLSRLKSNAPSMLEDRKKTAQDFETRLHETWKTPLDLLEMLLVMSFEVGAEINHQHRSTASTANDYVFDSLTRLHAKAQLVSSEILTLLKGGYASGAYSRWRTLHETVVTAFFISENGQDVAERYLLYDAIESYKAAIQYQEKHDQFKEYFELGQYQVISPEELTNLKDIRDQLCTRFGSAYGKNYGWAANILRKESPKSRVEFADIEAKVDLTHIRPFYKLASHSVHAESKGNFFNIGLPQNKPFLLAGASIFGLADPGQWTAISLNQITYTLIIYKRNVKNLLIALAMEDLVSEICQEFMRVHISIQANLTSGE